MRDDRAEKSTSQRSPGLGERLRRGMAIAAMGAGIVTLGGCPETRFPDEGTPQPTDRASGKAPPGSVGACKEKQSLRPPIVNPQLWENLPLCNRRTPRRYLRVGYGDKRDEAEAKKAQARMKLVLETVQRAPKEKDENMAMVTMIREIHRIAAKDPKLRPRLERSSARTFACDYAYLFETTSEAYRKVADTEDPCPAHAYDPKLRRDVCLFDMSQPGTQWLTGAWSCLAFTETAGEGGSCHRLCDYDDHCASQVSCAQPDFDLMLCTMGICMPEDVAGFY